MTRPDWPLCMQFRLQCDMIGQFCCICFYGLLIGHLLLSVMVINVPVRPCFGGPLGFLFVFFPALLATVGSSSVVHRCFTLIPSRLSCVFQNCFALIPSINNSSPPKYATVISSSFYCTLITSSLSPPKIRCTNSK